MTDFVFIHLNRINQEQLSILQAAVRLAGDNLEILYQKGILSEDYVAAYADFLKELGNEFTRVDHWFSSDVDYDSLGVKTVSLFDFDHLPCGGKLDCYPDNKGGDSDE